MRATDTMAVLICLATAFAYVNFRFIKLPLMVGLMLLSLIFSILLLVGSALGLNVAPAAQAFVGKIDFNELLLEGMLSFLLFAGSLSVDVETLLRVKADIAAFAFVGVAISTALVAGGFYALSQWLGLGIPLIYCLIFGALISPTDPVAVLAVLRQQRVSAKLSARIDGEALFNDGIGIVLYLTLVALASGTGSIGPLGVTLLFVRQAIGGIAFGFAIGYVGYLLLKSVDDYALEVGLTLALVSGGYSLARELGVSGPLAMVVAGLLVGSRGRRLAMSEATRENLGRFWELVNLILNAVLFTLIGLEILVLLGDLIPKRLLAALATVPLVVGARFIAVAVIKRALAVFKSFEPGAVMIMTWSGIRGGISIALALALPQHHGRDTVILATYTVVVFTMLVQATTLKYVIKHEVG